MFESILEINSKSKVISFKKYSNASKVMKSSSSKEDEIMKFSNKQLSYFIFYLLNFKNKFQRFESKKIIRPLIKSLL